MSIPNVHPPHSESLPEVQVQLALSAQDFARAKQFANAKQLPVEVYLQERIVDALDETKKERLAKFQEAVEALHATILEDKKHWTKEDWEKEWQNMQRIAKEVRREQNALYLQNYPEILAKHSEIQAIALDPTLSADDIAHRQKVEAFKGLRDIFTAAGVTEEEMLEALKEQREELYRQKQQKQAMQDLQHAMAQEAEREWSKEELLELERSHNEVRYEQSEAALAHQPEYLANLKAYNEKHKDRLTFRHLPAIFIESGIARGEMLETLMDIWREVNAQDVMPLHASQASY